MKIMLLEDNALTLKQIPDIIGLERKLNGVQIYKCKDLDFARKVVNDNLVVDVLVSDLMIDPLGITDEEFKKTQSGILTGWIWAKDHMLLRPTYENTKVIIFSDYIENLETYFEMEKEERKRFSNRLVEIRKAGKRESGIDFLIETLIKLYREWNI